MISQYLFHFYGLSYRPIIFSVFQQLINNSFLNNNFMTNQQLQNESRFDFIIKPRRESCFHEQTRLSFKNETNSNDKANANIPTFNADQCQWTPSFALPKDKNFYLYNAMFLKLEFQQKIQRSLIPFAACHPSANLDFCNIAYPDSKYCQVCKLSFEKYCDHILLKTHQQKVNNHKINKVIQSLCQSFKGNQKREILSFKKKIITKKADSKKSNRKEAGPTSSSMALLQMTNGSQNGSTQTHQMP